MKLRVNLSRPTEPGRAARIRLAAATVLLVVLAVTPTRAVAASTYVFGKATLPANGGGASLVQGDFNGDGSTDFAWANPTGPTISIVVSKPNGAFAAKVDVDAAAPGSTAGFIAVADFNNDGKQDLAVADGDGTTSLLLGNGDGTFAARSALSILSTGLGVGDFNGDGNADLVAANGTSSAVYLGDGRGAFTKDTGVPTGVISATAAVADFDDDGFEDVMFSGTSGTATVLLGDGEGGFHTAASSAGLEPGAIADFDGDGILDSAYTVKTCGRYTCTEHVYEFLGNGDGTFTEQIHTTTVNGKTTAADFNRDGKTDLLVVPGGILFGNGDGTFGSVSPIPVGSPTTAVVGDFNHDGQLDIAALDSGGSLVVALGRLGAFPAPVASSVATTFTPLHAFFGDLNDDGKPDRVTIDGSIQVQFGNGDGTFQSPIATSLPSSYEGSAVIADFNGDGKRDLAVLPYGTSITEFTTYLGNGDGTFGLPITGAGYNRWPLSGVAIDLNGDGILDLAVSAQNGATGVDVFLGNGDGSFQSNTTYPTCFAGWGGTMAHDFNGDGAMDVAVGCDDFNGGINVLLGNGNGTMRPAAGYTAGNVYDNSVAMGDFDGDGRYDLAVSGFAGITTFLGRADGTFGPGVATSTAVATWLATDDVDNDGKSDLICLYGGNSLSNAALLLSNGDGTYLKSFVPLPAATDPGPAVLDVNGDGALDIVSSVTGSTTLTTYDMASSPVAFASAARMSFPYQVVGTTSEPRLLTLSNPGAAPLGVGVVTATGDFTIASDDCGATLAVNASCTIGVTFAPSATGIRTGTLSIDSNSVGGASSIDLTGTGEGAGPVVVVSPQSLIFGAQLVGTTSAPQTVTVSSVGGAPVTLTSIVASGDFTETNDCPATLPAGASCVLTIAFRPTVSGARTGSIVLTDGAGTQTVSLSGTGVAPALAISPSSLTFPTQLILTSSKVQKIQLTNTGSATLTISGIAITGINSGDFSQTSTCGTSLPAGGGCTISVTFKPLAINGRTASVTVTDDASGSPHTVPLGGTGTEVSLSPVTLSFGSVRVGSSSTKTVTFSNSGSTAVSISGISIGGTNAGDFSQTNTCGSSLPARKSCTISVKFLPSAKGARSGTVSVTDDGGGSPQISSLTGTGK